MMSIMVAIGSSSWRRLGSGVIPVAFAAALPLVQWCWICSPLSARACPGVPTAPASAPPACASGHEACAEHGAKEGQCPFERRSGRTFCVGAAMGGLGVRPHAPVLPAPALESVFLVPEPPTLDTAREPARLGREAEARPPTPGWVRRPPVRGPPVA
jgi:hypothetical protein